MSYNIAILVPPIPVEDAEAWKAVDSLIDLQGPRPVVLKKLHGRLTAKYPCLCSLTDDQIDDGVWSDGPLINNFGHRAAVLGISYSRVAEVLPFLVESANDLGLVVVDWATEQIHRGDGFKGYTLFVENEPTVWAPRMEVLLEAVERLTPRGGPGFLILEGRGQEYTQAAGGDGAYSAEWREYSGDIFHHWVAGLPDLPSTREVAIPTNGFQVMVMENERLAALDVQAILSAFAEGNGRPKQFTWREVTERFT